MACQTDRSLKSTLTPIVSKLSDMRVVNGSWKIWSSAPARFVTMAILVLINIPLVRFINTDWYHTLVDTIPGQMVICRLHRSRIRVLCLCGEADPAY